MTTDDRTSIVDRRSQRRLRNFLLYGIAVSLAGFVIATYYVVAILSPEGSGGAGAGAGAGGHYANPSNLVAQRRRRSGTTVLPPEELEINEENDYESWPHPFVHVVNTRFMQEQSRLVDLTFARLELFRTFCLPSMTHQTANVDETATKTTTPTPNHLWIVKIDPDLDSRATEELAALLSPHPHYFLVGSNDNFGVGSDPGGWRDGRAGEDLLSAAREGRVFAGDLRLLRAAHAARETAITLETRLDADDGLRRDLLEDVQRRALRTLGGDNTKEVESSEQRRTPPRTTTATTTTAATATKHKWIYWCVSNHVEWFPTTTAIRDGATTMTDGSPDGRVVERATDAFAGTVRVPVVRECVTPGLTLGMAVGTSESEVQRWPHHKLMKNLLTKGECGTDDRGRPLKPSACLDMVNRHFASALRSRTPTSAGMKDVVVVGTGGGTGAAAADAPREKSPPPRDPLWDVLERDFGVTRASAGRANAYVRDHLLEIATDNIRGQCTSGHSCKISSKEKLQEVLDVVGGFHERPGLVAVYGS